MNLQPPHPSRAQLPLSQRALQSSGQPIGKLMAQALRYPHLISLAAGFVDNATLPCEEVATTMAKLAGDELRLRKSLQYGSTAGMEELRQAIVDWNYAPWPNHSVTIDRMILASGSNQLLHLTAEAILDRGDIVIAAAPTYFVFLGTLRATGARTIGVHADADGMCMDALRKQLDAIVQAGQASRLKAIYCVTDFDNPGASSLSLDRRHELLRIVEQWRRDHGPLLLISDNAYQHLRYDGPILPPLISLSPLASEFVIDLGTFSKVFSPGIRVGWGVFPQAWIEPLLDIKSNIDFGSPNFSQTIVHSALESGELLHHLPTICEGYRIKRDVMLAAMDQHMSDLPGVQWAKPHGGLYVWLRLRKDIDASESGRLWQLATEHGVLYVPGHHCYPAEGQVVERNSLRLSFGVQSADRIRSGIERLAVAIREL
jgi:2-aminoadipate transaminase